MGLFRYLTHSFFTCLYYIMLCLISFRYQPTKTSLHQDASGGDSDLTVLLENSIHKSLCLYPKELSTSVSAVEVPVSFLPSCDRQQNITLSFELLRWTATQICPYFRYCSHVRVYTDYFLGPQEDHIKCRRNL